MKPYLLAMLSKGRAHLMQGAALCALPSYRRHRWLRHPLERKGIRFVEVQRRALEKIWDEEDYQNYQAATKMISSLINAN